MEDKTDPNCPAQNTNKAMLVGYAEKMTLLFLMKGHTKKDCDHFFNLLKWGSVGEDTWSAKELDRAYMKINESDIDLTRLDERINHWRAWSRVLIIIIERHHPFKPRIRLRGIQQADKIQVA